MKIASEEIFGPVASLFKFTTKDEVIQRANKVDVGLASYVMTTDFARAYSFREARVWYGYSQ
jgi:succinate-semialdehyde dehydrogenase / glutarate-semialdehyde dehydrogenase